MYPFLSHHIYKAPGAFDRNVEGTGCFFCFSRKEMLYVIWKEPYYQDDGNIMSIISKLRKKIEPDPEHHFYVLTVYGVGYRFNEKA